MTRRPTVAAALGLAIFGSPFLLRGAESPGSQVDFVHSVQPLLREACYSCHGAQKSKGGLRLDIKARALKGGENGAVILPGNAAKSPLLSRLTSSDPEERMPQKADPLSPQQIKLIQDWINQGAKWPETVSGGDPARHWAFQPIKPVRPPDVRHTKWVRNPIDRFILSRLEQKNIMPNGPAQRRQLIRRVTLDLLGLPPEPQEVEAFLADRSANAYEKLVDRLLANPHYGERWARHWLDAARFAESDGFEQDTDRPNAFWYRDFTIKALNDDMPYDQFVRWQIAGDEFAPDNPWAMAATGFIGAEQFPTQLTEAEFEPARYDELDNMTSTVGTAMLGLTVGCARCHDHKYDPISTEEYYRLVSIFATTIRSDVDLEFNHTQFLRAKADFEAAHQPLTNALDEFERKQLPENLAQWARTRSAQDLPTVDWILLQPEVTKSQGGATFSPQPDGSFLVGGPNPEFDTFTFVVPTRLTNITAIRVEALADHSLAKAGPGRVPNGNFDLTDLRVTARPISPAADASNRDDTNQTVFVKLANPRSTFNQSSNLSVALVIDEDKKSGWAVDPQFGTNHAAAFEFATPVGFVDGTELTITLDFQGNNQHAIGRPRLSVATLPSPRSLTNEPSPEALVAAFHSLGGSGDLAKLSNPERAALTTWYRARDPEWRKLNDAIQTHLQKAPKPNRKRVMVTSEGLPPLPHFADGRGFPHFYPKTYFLKRGDANKKGEVATPGFLKILERSPDAERHWQEPKPSEARTSYRRRALANWLTDPKSGAGQLLARVIVNRLWHHHFGRGIVATPNDFGLQGERPTNPELLDWLANDLIQNGWQLKRIHKLILLSATYQEADSSDESRSGLDRENRLLWHWPRRRLEAEAIRDSMLAVSGELDPTMYGPGSLQPGMRRRSVYFFIKRSQLIPTLMLFDFPEPNASVGGRVSTTIAPQALSAMNSPQVREYARAFANRLEPIRAVSGPRAISQAYELALGRNPTRVELSQAGDFIARQASTYRANNQPHDQQLALADFCQVLLGLNEFLYLE